MSVENVIVRDSDLCRAVGRVAVESALLDEFLRDLILEMLGDGDTWIFLEGQNTEWLIDTSQKLLGYINEDYRRWTVQQHEHFISLMQQARRLRELRNFVIHGIWLQQGARGTEECRRRPWGEGGDSAIYCSLRSRYKKLPEGQQFSVGDIERLANELRGTYESLRDHFREMAKRR